MTNFIFIHGNKHFAIGPIRRKDLQLVCYVNIDLHLRHVLGSIVPSQKK